MERRKFPRLNINVNLRWHKIADSQSKSLHNKDLAKNISAAGICLTTYKRLKKGDNLFLEMELPTEKVIHSGGRVVWVSEFEAEGPQGQKRFDAGVEFVDIRNEEREEIKRFVINSSR